MNVKMTCDKNFCSLFYFYLLYRFIVIIIKKGKTCLYKWLALVVRDGPTYESQIFIFILIFYLLYIICPIFHSCASFPSYLNFFGVTFPHLNLVFNFLILLIITINIIIYVYFFFAYHYYYLSIFLLFITYLSKIILYL